MSTESYIRTEVDSSSEPVLDVPMSIDQQVSSVYSSSFEPEVSESTNLPSDLTKRLTRILRKNESLRQIEGQHQPHRKQLFKDKLATLKNPQKPYAADLPLEVPIAMVEQLRIRNLITSLRREAEELEEEKIREETQKTAEEKRFQTIVQTDQTERAIETVYINLLHKRNQAVD